MYLPIVHVAAFALVPQVLSRASLRAIGFTAVVLTLGSIQMLGLKSTVPATQPTIKIVQWNVLWGGVHRSWTWPAIISILRDASADILLLTEPPPGELLEQMRTSLGESWKIAQVKHTHERHATDLVIASRYSITIEDTLNPSDARMICAQMNSLRKWFACCWWMACPIPSSLRPHRAAQLRNTLKRAAKKRAE